MSDSYYYREAGVDEILGLKEALASLMKPVVKAIKEKTYWNEGMKAEFTEYKSRDGFIPHSHNKGGLQVSIIVPYSEHHAFDILPQPDIDERDSIDEEEIISMEHDGLLDSLLRIWIKYEGKEDGKMKFWFFVGGGNGDAPYFRPKHQDTYFEQELKVKSIAELKTKGKKIIQKIIKIL